MVGTGFIGRIHARAARQAGARLVGIAGADLANATEGAEALGAEKAFDSVTELITSGLIDVLHVCTPNHLHAPIALEAMDAGLAVICEKPLATEAPTAQLMAEQAKGAGVVAAVPFVYRFHPMVREARETSLLRAKYDQHPELAEILLATDDATMIYDDMDSTFWGDNAGRGRNWTGRLLELVRSELHMQRTGIPGL
ncbi:Gfo/Idh/MocA family oxidoreductase [Streptomyces sp. NBC_00090]|uniref:Gfo/Idh/MocA family oxidoreductase n=1 Tax=Streptomyces sp. NBC_00090 TaxID=2903619 RepID=UPI00386E4886